MAFQESAKLQAVKLVARAQWPEMEDVRHSLEGWYRVTRKGYTLGWVDPHGQSWSWDNSHTMHAGISYQEIIEEED